MYTKNKLALTDRLVEVATAVALAESRLVNVRWELEAVAGSVPAAKALHFLNQATPYLAPLFGTLRELIHDPACEAVRLQSGGPSAKGQGPSTSGQQPAADTQSGNEHKPGSAESFSTLFRSVLPGLNIGNQNVAESVLAQFLNGPESESESGFDSECPVVAQVASLTEQVTTLQDDVKTLVEICQSQQNQLKLLKEAVFTNANSSKRKVAIGNRLLTCGGL